MRRVELPATIDIATCDAVRDTLAGEHGDLVLDGGAVRRIDAAGLQLIVAAVAAAHVRGAAASWHAVSPVLVEAAAVTGLAAALGLDRKG
nr:STAS domain-containing protein [Kofleriaceae bacterium]